MADRILVVDDEKDIRMLIKACLVNEGYEVVEASDGEKALELFDESFSMVLLDMMMPNKDGLSTCLEIRQSSKVPIIFLTAKSQDGDMVFGLTAGADDYITKPFTPPVLVARVKANIRRFKTFNEQSDQTSKKIVVKDIHIDEMSHEVFVAGEEVVLTKTEFDILVLFAKHPNQVFSIERIYEHVWGEAFLDGSSNTVMVHIKKLRSKLEKANDAYDYIKTVWGVGYKIEK